MTTQTPSPDARIVVGVDGSKQSKLALSWAVRISATTGASIDAVTAWHFPVNFGWGYVPDEWDPIADATKCLTDSIDEAFGAERPTGLRLLVQEGLPAKVLLVEQRGNHAHRRQPRPRRILRHASRVGQRQLCRTRDVSNARHSRRPTNPLGHRMARHTDPASRKPHQQQPPMKPHRTHDHPKRRPRSGNGNR
jgi:nucleotide-binding universal stress UspA family protein